MNTILMSLVFLTIVGIFAQRWAEISKDADVGPANLNFGEWFKLSIVEIALNLLLFTALVLGVNVDTLIKASEAVSTGIGSATDVTSIAGAFATGTAIYKAVQLVLLPMWNLITGANTARKKLRTKVATELQK